MASEPGRVTPVHVRNGLAARRAAAGIWCASANRVDATRLAGVAHNPAYQPERPAPGFESFILTPFVPLPYRWDVTLAPSPVPWPVSLLECYCHDQPPSVVATLPAAGHSAGAFLFGWLHCEVRLLPSLASLRRSIEADISAMPLGFSPPVVHCLRSVAWGHLRPWTAGATTVRPLLSRRLSNVVQIKLHNPCGRCD